MKKLIIALFVTFLFANPNILFKEGKYLKAAKEYLKIGTQEAIYDAANSYYRAKEYQKAINLYKKITKPSLKFKALYNMGNAYAFSNQLLKAKEAYEKALKIKKDKDAEYNLKIIEKLLKQKHKKNHKNNKKKNHKKNSPKHSNKKNNQHSSKNNTKKSNKHNHKNQKQNHKKNQKNSKKSNKKNSNNKLQKSIQTKKSTHKRKKQFIRIKETNTSDIRNKYYELMLKNLKFNTLLLPLRSEENEK